jgi:hypothetical protein
MLKQTFKPAKLAKPAKPVGGSRVPQGCLYAVLLPIPAAGLFVVAVFVGALLKLFGVFVAVAVVALLVFRARQKHPGRSSRVFFGISALIALGLVSGAIAQRNSEARFADDDLFAIEVREYEPSPIRQVSNATYAKQMTLVKDRSPSAGRSMFFGPSGDYVTSWRARAVQLGWSVIQECRAERTWVLLESENRKARVEDRADGDVTITIGPAEDLRFASRYDRQ